MTHTGRKAELYLIASELTPAVSGRLAAALGAAAPTTVLLPAGDAAALVPLVRLVQDKNIAALIADDADLARSLGADGVHLTWSPDLAERYARARASLGAGSIVGIDAGGSRHDAMILGEAGADYIAFSPPPHVHDGEERAELQADLVGWWSELFEVPCVAFDVSSASEADELVQAGADFVALRLPSGDVSGSADLIRAVAGILGHRHEPGRSE